MGDQARNPGMYPNQESNQRPVASRDKAQPTEPRGPELSIHLNIKLRTYVLKVDLYARESKLMAYVRLYVLCTNRFPKLSGSNRYIRKEINISILVFFFLS